MKYIKLISLILMMSTPAVAQHAHGQQNGPNGGQMEDVAGVHLELVTKGSDVTLHVYDEASKPISTKGFSASILVTAGSDRETLTLASENENRLKGQTKKPIAAGATVAVTLKTAAGKSGQVRFKD